MRLRPVRFLLSLAVGLAVAMSSYAGAVTFSTLTDSDLQCDTNSIDVAGWGVFPLTDEVRNVSLTEIDPACVGAELWVVVSSASGPLADAQLTVGAGQTGVNVATLVFTSLGASAAPVSLRAVDIESASVLIHNGSEAAVGIAESPCEFIGASIDGWDVDPLSAQLSGVRITDISPLCIGNEVVVELLQAGTVIRDGRIFLNGGNTGASLLTVALTAPGASTAPLSVHASLPTSIQISVIGEDPVPPGPPGNNNNGNNGQQDGDSAGDDAPSPTSQTLGTQSTGQQNNQPAPGQDLVNEVAGVQDQPTRLPLTGTYMPLTPAPLGLPALTVYFGGIAVAILIAVLLWLSGRRERQRSEA